MDKIKSIFKWLFGNKIRLIILVLIVAVVGFLGYRNYSSKNKAPQYQTAQVTRGTLITSVSASGQITSGNSVNITTQASGVVKDVLVKNGETVKAGQVLADLTVDQASQQKETAAYASYLQAQNSVNSAEANLNTLQNTEFTANQKLINDAVARDLATDDPTYVEENAAWLAAEANYKNQQGVIAAAQSSLSSSALTLQQTSSSITAPIAGVVTGLTIVPGSQIINTAQTSSSNNSATLQSIGSVNQQGSIQAQVNISEVDAVSVTADQKVTMTLDAFPDKTFTGKILGVNTNGVVSSGVTTYPAIISFDSNQASIYPNMGVTANIITKVKDDVLMVPTGAIQTQNGQSTVRVLNNNQIQNVPVTAGDSNDTDTEITSGLTEGQTVVTGVVSAATTGTTTSPFGGGARGVFGGGGAGGAVRVGGRGG